MKLKFKTIFKFAFIALKVIILLILSSVLVFAIFVNLPLTRPAVKSNTQPLLLQNVRIIDVAKNSISEEQSILIANGRIASIGFTTGTKIPPSTQVINGKGKYVLPALWDMHAHYFSPYAPETRMPLNLAAGVTNLRVMTAGHPNSDRIDFRQLDTWRRQIIKGELLGPRVMQQGSFPIRAPILRGADEPDYFYPSNAEQAKKLVDYLGQLGVEAIKTYNGVPPKAYFALLKEAQKRRISVIGHRPLAVSALDAIKSGHRSLAHGRLLINESYKGASAIRRQYKAYFAGKQRNRPKDPTWKKLQEHDAALLDSIIYAMVEYKTWFCPTHLTRKMDAFAGDSTYRNDERLKYIDWTTRKFDWNRDTDRTARREAYKQGYYKAYYHRGLELTGQAFRAGVKILAGTDSGDTYCFPGSGLHDELAELVKAGLSPVEALRTATINPAEYMGLGKDYGAVVEGKVADILVLDKNPLEDIANIREINALIYNGALYQRHDLDQMLDIVEENVSSINLICKMFSFEFKIFWHELKTEGF